MPGCPAEMSVTRNKGFHSRVGKAPERFRRHGMDPVQVRLNGEICQYALCPARYGNEAADVVTGKDTGRFDGDSRGVHIDSNGDSELGGHGQGPSTKHRTAACLTATRISRSDPRTKKSGEARHVLPPVSWQAVVMEPMDCLVIYVPLEAAQAVRQAIGDAGAGRLGNYSHCSFSTGGTGRFTPLPGAHPAIGVVSSPEEVPETRIEAIYPRSRRDAVVGAALAVHPYETPAFMTFPVDASVPDGTGQSAD